jgi:cytochrome c peroxidase
MALATGSAAAGVHDWTPGEVEVLRSLWIESLPPIPNDASNRYEQEPRAASLGRKFFFDKRFSGNNQVSCGTCHREDYAFTDDLPLAHGMGTTGRRTMTLIGSAYYPWLFWDGRKDSMWSQALGPLESTVEHGISRTFSAKVIAEYYRAEYEAIFGPLPNLEGLRKLGARPGLDDPAAYKAWIKYPPEEREAVNRVYANMGKAIAAYVRTIVPGPARFDEYVSAVVKGRMADLPSLFSDEEAEGLRIFIGKAKCTGCHTGPLFTNGEFHNLQIPATQEMPFDMGRGGGIIQVLSDEFNCLGPYSDARGKQCAELWFMDTETKKYTGAMKTPTLRNVVERPPFMHAGQFTTIKEVLKFYKKSRNPEVGHRDLTNADMRKVEAFLRTLSGPILSLGE